MDTTSNTRLRLAIRIGQGTLSFSTIEKGTDGSDKVVYEPYPLNSGISIAANLREAFKEATLLAVSYQSVSVLIDSPVLIIPSDMYVEKELTLLYDHSFPSSVSNRVVLPCVLPTLSAVAAFSLSKDLKMVVDDHFAGARFGCVAAPVWRYLQQRSYTGTRSKLYGYFHGRRLDVFSFSQNRFKYCNAFDVAQPNDALYYLLYVWKQLRMSNDNDELHIVGDIPEQDFVVEELRGFLQRVYVINPAGDFNRAPVTQIEGMPYDLMTYYVKGM